MNMLSKNFVFTAIATLLATILIFSMPGFEKWEIQAQAETGLLARWTFNSLNGTQVPDTSGHNKHGTLAGGWTTGPGRDGTAVRFNGTSGRVIVPDSMYSFGNASWTLAVWLKTSSSNDSYLISKGDGSDLRMSSGRALFTISAGGSFNNLFGHRILNDGIWHDVVATRSGSSLSIYIDGVLDISGSLNGTPDMGVTMLAARSGNSDWFDGWLDDVRIYNRALSSSEVASLYGTPAPTPTPEPTDSPESTPTPTPTPVPTPTPTPVPTPTPTPVPTPTPAPSPTPTPGSSPTLISTYLGGVAEDTIRDITTDSAGNMYITGGTASSNFPTTTGAYDRTQNGNMDVFVAKLSSTGTLLWSTFIGGPNYDRAYAIELDPNGNVIVSGRAGRNFPVTGNAFQTNFQGYNTGSLYGEQNAFVCKLTASGASVMWCSYEGPFEMNRDIAVDSVGDIYGVANYDPADGGSLNASWFANAFQKTPQGDYDGVIVKIRSDGSQVMWATLIGGSAFDSGTPSIRVDASSSPYVLLYTQSSNMPTTAGAFDRTYNGGGDLYVAKVNSTGTGLVYATYLGGNASEYSETHGLSIDFSGNAYVTATTNSSNFPTTSGAFDRTFNGSGAAGTNYNGDGFVAKLSANGSTLLGGTFVGGSDGDGIEGSGVDGAGNIFVTGATYSTNFPITSNAFQSTNRGRGDLFAAILSSDFTHLVYSTYVGGTGTDYGRSLTTDASGSFCVVGHSDSGDFPVQSAVQTVNRGNQDGVLVRFPQAASGQSLSMLTWFGLDGSNSPYGISGSEFVTLQALSNSPDNANSSAPGQAKADLRNQSHLAVAISSVEDLYYGPANAIRFPSETTPLRKHLLIK